MHTWQVETKNNTTQILYVFTLSIQWQNQRGVGALQAHKHARALVAALIIYELLLATGDECRFVDFAEKLHYSNGGAYREGDPHD